MEHPLRYHCIRCNRIVQHPCRKQHETETIIGLTVLNDPNRTVAHRRVRQCENCRAEEFATLEIKEADFQELLKQIKSAQASAMAARQELASLKRAVLNALDLNSKPVRSRPVSA